MAVSSSNLQLLFSYFCVKILQRNIAQHDSWQRDIEFEDDITRDIMKNDVRDIRDQSYRNLRDWWIYRDYMNGLEYIINKTVILYIRRLL